MAKKKKDNIKISFVGSNSSSVTGSMTLIEFANKKILLEAGLYQSSNMKESYEINNRRFDFKPTQIDYIFLNHNHADHSCLLPRLYANGCKAKIITPRDSSKFLNILLKDSCRIMNSDREYLIKKHNKALMPIYNIEDVETTLEYIEEYNFNELYKIDDVVSFMFVPSGHIIRAAQLVLYITQNGHTKKLLYTSDIGNLNLCGIKPFIEPFEPVEKADIAIVESTYANRERCIGIKDYQKDLEKMKSIINETCILRESRVLIPSFSMDRSQFLLKILYDLFGNDTSFDIPIIVDSPMTCKIFDVYSEILTGKDKELFDKMINWKNVRFIRESDESRSVVGDKSPKVIISSSGMLTKGRSKNYCKSLLPDENACILFCGFSVSGSLASKIKDGKEQKTITIDNKPIRNRCNIVGLSSLSSHIQRNDMINYYSDISCNAIYLVHGNMEGKIELAKDLKVRLEEENKSTKVIVTNKSTKVNL
jgi:metallo-beta-lactamase family protein